MLVQARRKARIEATLEIRNPRAEPASVAPGVCWIERRAAGVALHLDAGTGMNESHEVVHLSDLQFQQALASRQLVFISW